MIHICVLPSGLVTISMLMQRSAVWRWLTSLVCMYAEAGQKRTDVEMADLNLEICGCGTEGGDGWLNPGCLCIFGCGTEVGQGGDGWLNPGCLYICGCGTEGGDGWLNPGCLYICGCGTEVGQGGDGWLNPGCLYICGCGTEVGQGGDGWLELRSLCICGCGTEGGDGWLNLGCLYICGCGTEVGQGGGGWLELWKSVHLWGQDRSGTGWRWLTWTLEVCTSVGAEVGQGGGGWRAWKSTSVGAGQKWDRVETADEPDLNLAVLCLGDRTEVGQGGDGWWARLEPGSLMSVGTGQKWDRVETADEHDLNLAVLCLWGQDRSGTGWRRLMSTTWTWQSYVCGDRVETADEHDLNLAVLCLWGQDRSGTGWRRLMSPTWTWQSYVCGDRTEVGQGGDGWWARLEPGSLMSVGTGQKWDRVETADEPDLNLAVLCLWGQDRSGTADEPDLNLAVLCLWGQDRSGTGWRQLMSPTWTWQSYVCGDRTEVRQGGDGWWARLEPGSLMSVGTGWRRLMSTTWTWQSYVCGDRTEVGQGGDGWWARLEPGSLMSVGTGQKWDRVETADEPDLNLAVLCLWGQDRSGTGWRRLMSPTWTWQSYVCGDRTEVGQLMSPTWTWQSYVCGDRTEVGQGGDSWWARLEPGSLMSVGTGQKCDRVETADEHDLNLAVLCLWGQGGDGWWARLEPGSLMSVGTGWRRLMSTTWTWQSYVCGDRTEVGQGGDGWWARLEPGSLMSVGTGQKWDRVETADEHDLNLAVLCLWGQDRSGTGWRRLMSTTWTWQSYVCGDRTEVGQRSGPWSYLYVWAIYISTLQVAHFAHLLALVSSKPNIRKARLVITQKFALCEDCDFIYNCCNIFSSHFCNNVK